MEKAGKYYLIKNRINSDEIEFFDFEKMDFMDGPVKSVDLATIDALTSLFVDGQDLDNYLNKTNNHERDYEFLYKIIYKTKKNEEFRELDAIWNDKNISALSKISDSKVDFKNNISKELIFTVFEEVMNPNSGLARQIIKAKKNDLKLNDYNKKLIGVLASSKKVPFMDDFAEAFSSYKEYRTLYLNYKEYHDKKDNWKDILRSMK